MWSHLFELAFLRDFFVKFKIAINHLKPLFGIVSIQNLTSRCFSIKNNSKLTHHNSPEILRPGWGKGIRRVSSAFPSNDLFSRQLTIFFHVSALFHSPFAFIKEFKILFLRNSHIHSTNSFHSFVHNNDLKEQMISKLATIIWKPIIFLNYS